MNIKTLYQPRKSRHARRDIVALIARHYQNSILPGYTPAAIYLTPTDPGRLCKPVYGQHLSFLMKEQPMYTLPLNF